MARSSARTTRASSARSWALRRSRGTKKSAGLRFTQVIRLAELDPVVAEDVVGRRDVEVEVRQRVPHQVLQAGVAALAVAHLQDDLAILRAFDALGLH